MFKVLAISPGSCYNGGMKNLNNLLAQIEGEEKFSRYMNLLLKYNELFNLTSITKEREIYIKHFLDSVSGEEFIPKNASVCDVGAGAGFPSLPLALLRGDLKFTLFESTKKKCDFLKIAGEELHLENIRIENMRAEDAGRNPLFREKFDCCCARAVARLSSLAEYCLPLVRRGGVFLSYKGDAAEEIREGENALRILGGKLREVHEFSLPEEMGRRTLLVIEKVKVTPQSYPRGQGKERKCPL